MHIPKSYFLTPSKKLKMLKDLNEEIKAGNIDKEMIPYLQVINNFPGVMSLFCCEGHKDQNSGNGNILFLLSERVFESIYFVWQNPLWSYFNMKQASLDFFNRECRIMIEFNYKQRHSVLTALISVLNKVVE